MASPQPMGVPGHKCHAKPTKHAKHPKHTRPKKGNKGRKLGPQAAPSTAPRAKRAPLGSKPHRGKKTAKHPCA